VGNEVVVEVPKLKKDPAAQGRARALADAIVDALDACCAPLGLMQATPADFAARTKARRLKVRDLDPAAIDALVNARNAARAAKEFARSDAIRATLAQMGVELQDTPGGGTTWKVGI
jgi:cysteinyl-tRNA synthetase